MSSPLMRRASRSRVFFVLLGLHGKLPSQPVPGVDGGLQQILSLLPHSVRLLSLGIEVVQKLGKSSPPCVFHRHFHIAEPEQR